MTETKMISRRRKLSQISYADVSTYCVIDYANFLLMFKFEVHQIGPNWKKNIQSCSLVTLNLFF